MDTEQCKGRPEASSDFLSLVYLKFLRFGIFTGLLCTKESNKGVFKNMSRTVQQQNNSCEGHIT